MRRVTGQRCAGRWALRGMKECSDLLPCPLLWCKYSHQSPLYMTNIDGQWHWEDKHKTGSCESVFTAKHTAEFHYWRLKSTECGCEVKVSNSSVLSTAHLFYMIKLKRWGVHGCTGNCWQDSRWELEMVLSRNVAKTSFPFFMAAEGCLSLLCLR